MSLDGALDRLQDAIGTALEVLRKEIADAAGRAEFDRVRGLGELASWLQDVGAGFADRASLLRGARSLERPRTRIPRTTVRRVFGGIPQWAYDRPILEILAERGGSATASEVFDALERLFRSRFGELDLERTSSGRIRWLARAAWAATELRRAGLARTDGRGRWELTEKGRMWLAAGHQRLGG
jgi:hypothetical protein